MPTLDSQPSRCALFGGWAVFDLRFFAATFGRTPDQAFFSGLPPPLPLCLSSSRMLVFVVLCERWRTFHAVQTRFFYSISPQDCQRHSVYVPSPLLTCTLLLSSVKRRPGVGPSSYPPSLRTCHRDPNACLSSTALFSSDTLDEAGGPSSPFFF